VARFPNDWQLVKDNFVLPEKWYIKPNNLIEASILGEWYNNYIQGHGLYNTGNSAEIILELGLTINYGFDKSNDATEITFEQFKKYVLDMKDKKLIGYKLKDNAYKYEKAAIKILNSKSNNTILTWLNSKIVFGKDSSAERKFKDAGVLDI